VDLAYRGRNTPHALLERTQRLATFRDSALRHIQAIKDLLAS